MGNISQDIKFNYNNFGTCAIIQQHWVTLTPFSAVWSLDLTVRFHTTSRACWRWSSTCLLLQPQRPPSALCLSKTGPSWGSGSLTKHTTPTRYFSHVRVCSCSCTCACVSQHLKLIFYDSTLFLCVHCFYRVSYRNSFYVLSHVELIYTVIWHHHVFILH